MRPVYTRFSSIRHLCSPLHLPFLNKGQFMRAIFEFLKRTLASTLNSLPFSSSRKQVNSFSNQNGLAPKYLFVKNPQANPKENISKTVRKIAKGVKPLRIRVLNEASKTSNINNPLESIKDYTKKAKK